MPVNGLKSFEIAETQMGFSGSTLDIVNLTFKILKS